ncbi:hypothetical protein RvY_11249-2 [Ramazzottius varieornatus]|uniref:Uncharacterized protein n=1 Tax=Ramazzottius varieornatus TaxID=947166 RepID=A0A1D1VHX2_RAMVA|nr:hypothetical protein RvY_11249-2 [Ramazzottius varieornatus]
MSPYMSAFCGRNHSQVFDEDNTLTISSITYTPLSPSMLANHNADSTPCPLDPWASTTSAGPATQSKNTTETQDEERTQPTAPARDEEDSGVPITSANATSASSADLVAEQIEIVATALSSIDPIRNYLEQQKTVDGEPDTGQTEVPTVIRL